MELFSYLLRKGVWIVAAILFVSTFFVENGVFTFVLFLLVVFSALGYSWLDNETFGELLSNFAILSKEKETRVYDKTLQHHAVNDTYYHKDSPRDLVGLLEDLRRKNTHVQIHYGDPVTGLEERVVTGYVNCSSGAVQIPLLSQRGQHGGVPLLDHCIVQIIDVERDFILYQHPTYHQTEEEDDVVEAAVADEVEISNEEDAAAEVDIASEIDGADEVGDDFEEEFVFFEGPVRRTI